MPNYKHPSCIPALPSLLGFTSKRRPLAQSSSVMGPDHRRVSFRRSLNGRYVPVIYTGELLNNESPVYCSDNQIRPAGSSLAIRRDGRLYWRYRLGGPFSVISLQSALGSLARGEGQYH